MHDVKYYSNYLGRQVIKDETTLNNSVFIFTLVIMGLSFVFLIWDVSVNNGNIFWRPTIRAFDYIQESDEERIEKFQDNPIRLAFLDRYPDAIVTQELKYAGKYMYHTHTDGMMTTQLQIWDTGNNVHFGLSCFDAITGLDIHRGFIKNEAQLNSYTCE